MVRKKVVIFGASGQIGRHLIRKLTKNNHVVTAVTRNLHQKGYILKTQSPIGFLEIIEENIFNEEKLNNIINNHDICINLVGILFEKKNNTFQNIHVNFPSLLAKVCKEHNVEKLIHVSALGIDNALDSKYAISKLEGEKKIVKNFSKAVILRPSVCFSVDDQFTTHLMTLLSLLPFFPLYYNGKTKFTPIHCSDLTEIILYIINNNIFSEIIECVGPEEMTFKEIVQKLLKLIGKKRLLIPMPLIIAKVIASVFELLPKPLLTIDQLKLLKYDNILSGIYKSNKDLGIEAKLKFDIEVKKYSYMWADRGEYSKKDSN